MPSTQNSNSNIITDKFKTGNNVVFPKKNYAEFVIEYFVKIGNETALINGLTGEKTSFAELAQKIINTAASLSKLGVKRGDVVAVCSENRVEFLTTVYGVIYIGAIATFINDSYSKDDFIHTTNISKPSYIFFSPSTYKKYYGIAKDRGFKKYVVYGKTTETNCVDYRQLTENHTDFQSFRSADVDVTSTTAIIVYSSGTTGSPKGAKWTHLNLIISGLQDLPTSRPMTCLSIAPWANTIGFVVTTQNIINGNNVVFLPRFNEQLYLQCIEKYKVTFLIAVPALVIVLSKSTLLKDYDVTSVEIIYSGGSNMEAIIISQVKQRLRNLKCVLQGYGMTESCGKMTEESESFNKPGSVGKVVSGVIIKVVDRETGKILGPNKRGEVCLKGLALFGGYIGTGTRDDYDDEGFFKTGDIAYYDEEGYFFIVDRIKELIKFKSWQVSPSELEAVLLQHPGVKDTAVVGRPDSLAGELPTAFVVKQPGTKATAKEIFDFVASKVSPWKQLRGGITFVQEIPKNGSGKILRRQLREQLKSKPPSKL